MEQRIVVGLDIGTYSIKTVIAEVSDTGKIEVIGFAKKKSRGVRKGVIINCDEAIKAIQETIEAAEFEAGVEVESVITGIGGDQISGLDTEGMVGIDPKGYNRESEITPETKRKVDISAQQKAIPFGNQVLICLPQKYSVDGIETEDPIGTRGFRLELKAYLIFVAQSPLKSIEDCIRLSGGKYVLRGVFPYVVAAANATIQKEQEDLGSILIDMGASSTNVLVVKGKAPVFVTSIPSGGDTVTNDLAKVLGIPFDLAEDIKLKYGSAWLFGGEEKEEVIIPGIGQLPPESTDKKFISDIISARLEEIMTSVKKEVSKHTHLKKLDGCIFLVGGGAMMSGILELTQYVWQTRAVQVGQCSNFGNESKQDYRNAEFATATGLMLSYKYCENRPAATKVKAKASAPEKKENMLEKILKKFS